jgi:hypothetical protein
MMPLKCDPARKIIDDSGFSENTRQTSYVLWYTCILLEVSRTIISTCGPCNLGGSATATLYTLDTLHFHYSSSRICCRFIRL